MDNVKSFLNYLKVYKNYSELTIKNYYNDLTEFSIYIKKDLTRVKKEDIKSYLKYLFDKDNSNRTVSRKISTLKSFYKYLKENDVIKFSDLTIDIGGYEVIYRDNMVKLAPKELELLHYIASSPNKVFTREQLMYEVWGYDYPGDSRTVDVHIKRLREKLKGGETWEVQTVWGVGYKFEVK